MDSWSVTLLITSVVLGFLRTYSTTPNLFFRSTSFLLQPPDLFSKSTPSFLQAPKSLLHIHFLFSPIASYLLAQIPLLPCDVAQQRRGGGCKDDGPPPLFLLAPCFLCPAPAQLVLFPFSMRHINEHDWYPAHRLGSIKSLPGMSQSRCLHP